MCVKAYNDVFRKYGTSIFFSFQQHMHNVRNMLTCIVSRDRRNSQLEDQNEEENVLHKATGE